MTDRGLLTALFFMSGACATAYHAEAPAPLRRPSDDLAVRNAEEWRKGECRLNTTDQVLKASDSTNFADLRAYIGRNRNQGCYDEAYASAMLGAVAKREARALALRGDLKGARDLATNDPHIAPDERAELVRELDRKESAERERRDQEERNRLADARRDKAIQMMSDREVQRAAWSVTTCMWQDFRAYVVNSAKTEHRYAKELGGTVDPVKMQQLQARLREADSHLERARSGLRVLGKKPLPCKETRVRQAVSCFSAPQAVRNSHKCELLQVVFVLNPGRDHQ